MDTVFLRRTFATINCIYTMCLIDISIQAVLFSKEPLLPYIWVTRSLFQEANCSDLVFSRMLFFFLNKHLQSSSLREKCPYSELFWSAYSRISLRVQSECGKMWTRITPNTDTFYAVYPVYPYKRVITATYSFKLTTFLTNKNCRKEIS